MFLGMKPKTTPVPSPNAGEQGSGAAPVSPSRVDTSNLSPGAAQRFEKLMTSIDKFTSAVQDQSLSLADSN